MMAHSSGVYESLEPLYFLTLVVGLSPFGYNTIGRKFYYHSKWKVVYSFLCVISFLVLYFLCLYEPHNFDIPQITRKLDLFQEYFNIFLTLVLILLACKQKELLIKSTNLLDSIKYHIPKITKWLVTARLFLLLIITAGLVFANSTLTSAKSYNFSYWSYYYMIVLLPALVENQFATFTNFIRRAFVDINSKLSQPNTVRIVQVQHAELCMILRHVNKVFSVQLLLCVGLIFVASTLNLVHGFQKIKEEDLDLDMYIAFLWAVYYMSRLFYICRVGQKITDEANNTPILLHRISSHFDDVNTNTLLMFSKQLLHDKILLTAFGFFPINMSLFFSIIGAVAMYLLILVQMDLIVIDEGQLTYFNASNIQN